MAIMRESIIVDPRGSLNGIVFSRNRGGSYFRARAVPVNPNTTFQQAVRSAMAQLSAMWAAVLTDSQRASWDTYALNVPLPNSIGDPVNVGGVGMFVRTNVNIIANGAGGAAILTSAPTTFNLGDFTAPSVGVISESTQTVNLEFDNTDDWANEDDASMLVFLSRPRGPAVNYFKGPYRFAENIEGDAITAPTSPVTIASPFPFVQGQKIFAFVRVLRVDGRLSSPFRGVGVAGA